VSVTHRGQQLYQDCAPLINSLENSVELAIDDEIQFKGALTVSMPVRAGLDFLGNWLIDFASEHEALSLELSLSNINLNLAQENVDLAFRVGPLVDSSAIALRLWDIPYVLCASSAFIRRHNLNPDEVSLEQLTNLPAVVSLPAKSWTFIDTDNEEKRFKPNTQLTVDDLDLAHHAIEGGRFIGMLPTDTIKSEAIVTLSVPNHTPRTRTMFAYFLGKRHSISQIRHIVDYIKQRNETKTTDERTQ
jgi:DNA-binding transcriptional LysR family regulator